MVGHDRRSFHKLLWWVIVAMTHLPSPVCVEAVGFPPVLLWRCAPPLVPPTSTTSSTLLTTGAEASDVDEGEMYPNYHKKSALGTLTLLGSTQELGAHFGFCLNIRHTSGRHSHLLGCLHKCNNEACWWVKGEYDV
mmetsp:Transcript_42178/g.127967  ORF Transcript_42178/g.127967 Transcript_42178/m.127967 type:complete len:136 (-) Transcript_42178:95-502(-)